MKKALMILSVKLEFIKAFLFLMGFRRTGQKGQAGSGLGIVFAYGLGFRKCKVSGKINARGVSRVMSKKPLILSHTLQGSIRYQLNGQSVMVGTNMVYAKMMHFGGTKSAFPHLWGDIPARPFLGISASDKQILERMVVDYWQTV